MKYLLAVLQFVPWYVWVIAWLVTVILILLFNHGCHYREGDDDDT